jgi:iron complex outermembrane receptor protein
VNGKLNGLRKSILMELGVAGAVAAPGHSSAAEDRVDGRVGALEEIVVTAQKREQSMQDVPIAVTAFGEEALKANRVSDVLDLAAIAPNLTVLDTAGGHKAATFAMRGIIAQGHVAGQDKSVGVYIDGVQMAATRGSIFDLPMISRIEVLRGPQGTLFGRNSTAGAINIVTPEPSGQFGIYQQLSLGNFDQFKSTTSVDLPAFGPFSALVAYTHDEREGETRNLGAGQVWDRTAAGLGLATSPKTLGDDNTDSVFVALKFEPSDNFNIVYKYDYLEEDSTPGAMALLSLDGSILGGLADVSGADFAGASRPDSVNNSFLIPGRQEGEGHNLTINWRISDSLSLKSISGYRENLQAGSNQYDGFGGFTREGEPFIAMASTPETEGEQLSQEVQLNYDSDPLTLTAGAVYYDIENVNSGPGGGRLLNSTSFVTVAGGVLIPPSAAQYVDRQESHSKSIAGYIQTEWHVAPELDLVAGYRWTEDDKSEFDHTTRAGVTTAYRGRYKEAESTYLLGANYKPSDDLLLYLKYGTGFVAGGSVADVPYEPEKVKAWEAGLKADLLDARLRTNLAVFYAEYTDLQKTTQGINLAEPRPDLGSAITNEGDVPVKGVEVELTALATDKITLHAGFGYTHYELKNVNTRLFNPELQTYHLAFRTHATAALSAQYASDPLFRDVRLMARIDGNWHDKVRMVSRLPIPAGHALAEFAPARWLVNARAALTDISFSHGSRLEVALWAKNLLDEDSILWSQSVTTVTASTSYERARTWGVELTYDF